jgi:mono/diheme cytochrome c family protein
MLKLPRFLPLASILLLLPLTWYASHAPGSIRTVSLQTNTDPTPGAPAMQSTSESWITVDLPEDATQLQYGAEVYRLVCSACHAYDGTGLTDEWRATWGPDDQNCWQSKCHAENHPSDGFYLPNSPAIVGPIIPALFETAYDLFEYNYHQMPWHNPDSMTEEEAWAVTAYVLALNEIDPGPFLDSESASNIRFRPAEPAVDATPTEEPAPAATLTIPSAPATGTNIPIGTIIAGIVVFIIAIAAIYFLRRTSS